MSAWAAGVRAFRDPGSAARERSVEELATDFSRAWAYFRKKGAALYTQDYLARNNLYAHTRLLFNPVPTVVDFYEDHLYPAVPEILPSGAQLVTPMLEGASEELREAVAQLDQWSNWLSESHRFVRFCAVTGSVMCEVVDDEEGEKITHRIVWPGWVKDLELDNAGNVKAYALEYKTYDREKKADYTYRKEVDGEVFRYYRDGKLFDYDGRGAEVPNPYGFIPAVWCKHEDDGDNWGVGAVDDYAKIDEANSLQSHADDHAHKAIEKPKVLATSGEVHAVTGASGSTEKGGRVSAFDPRFDWMLLKMQDGTVEDLGSDFDLAQSDAQIERLLKSFERDYPELQAQTILENKAQISGTALQRLLAPSQAKLDRAAPNYNQQLIKFKQMGVAIGGWRLSNGWTRRDAQRRKFEGFGLESYAAGKLDFGLRRSLLVQESAMEEAELQAKRVETAKNAEGLWDELERIISTGKSREEAIQILARRAKMDAVTLARQYEAAEAGALVDDDRTEEGAIA